MNVYHWNELIAFSRMNIFFLMKNANIALAAIVIYALYIRHSAHITSHVLLLATTNETHTRHEKKQKMVGALLLMNAITIVWLDAIQFTFVDGDDVLRTTDFFIGLTDFYRWLICIYPHIHIRKIVFHLLNSFLRFFPNSLLFALCVYICIE